MSEIELQVFKKILLEKKENILKNLEDLKDSAKPVDLNEPIGRLSRMDAIQHQQMALNAKNQADITLSQIEAALKRIEQNEYGICLKCENDIPEHRLKAKPEAPFCTLCQK